MTGCSPALRRLFLAYARDEPFALVPPDHEKFLAECRYHGLMGCLADLVERHGHSSREFASLCREAFKAEFFKWARYQALQNQLEEALDRADLDALLLKGAALRMTVYRRPGLRPLSDIDLLVRPEAFDETARALVGIGLLSSPHGNRFSDFQGRNVDLHGPELGRVEAGCGLRSQDLWAGSQPVPGSRVWRVLEPRTNLAHLAVHALKHSYSRLGWLMDIELVAREAGVRQIEHVAAARAVQSALYVCGELVGRRADPPGRFQGRILLGMLARDLHPLGQMLLAWHQPRWRDRFDFLRESASEAPAYETTDSVTSRMVRLSIRLVRLLVEQVLPRGRKSMSRDEARAPDD
ncbi:MAG: hypothetical protein AMXMBFR33_12440 [Candidatus Xenobia bacterium]